MVRLNFHEYNEDPRPPLAPWARKLLVYVGSVLSLFFSFPLTFVGYAAWVVVVVVVGGSGMCVCVCVCVCE